MLREISNKELTTVLDFAWKFSKNVETASYPRYKDKNILRENLQKRFNNADSRVLGYYKENELIAVIDFFFIESEKYLQTTGVYIKSNYNEVMNGFMNLLKNEYRDYRALFGFPKENIEANSFFINRGDKCLDSCLDMRLDTYNFMPVNTKIDLVEITKENFDAYADFHDKHFINVYWTSNRLRESLDKWHIFAYEVDEQIVGSIFSTFCNEFTIEIFGAAVLEEYKEYKIKERLVSG